MKFSTAIITAALFFSSSATLAQNWDALCFAPVTEEKLREMEAHLKDQFTSNAGLDVVSVRVVPAGIEPPRFEVTVVYRPNASGTPSGTTDTLVIPFNCGD